MRQKAGGEAQAGPVDENTWTFRGAPAVKCYGRWMTNRSSIFHLKFQQKLIFSARDEVSFRSAPSLVDSAKDR